MFKLKKSWNEKLNESKDLPKIEVVTEKMSQKWGTGTVLIPAPIEVDAIMKKVRKGRLITINLIRDLLAKKHDASFGCPITTGIFALVAARAAEENEQAGKKRITPYWRTLKAKGEINPKYPGGLDRQKQLLESEGHEVLVRGKRAFVVDFEKRLATLRID